MNLIGGEGQARARVFKFISPLNEPQPGMPPAIFFFGTDERRRPFSRGFCEKCIALGNPNEVWTAAGVAHGFFNNQPWHDAVLSKNDEFFTRLGYLGGQPQVTPAASPVLRRELPE